jgi:hypothetical protein
MSFVLPERPSRVVADKYLTRCSGAVMDDQPNQIPDDLVTLTPAEVGDLQRRIDRFEGAVDALRLLARRSYFPPEQAARISAEADELVQSVEPLWAQRATLSQEALSTGLHATVDEIGNRKSPR